MVWQQHPVSLRLASPRPFHSLISFPSHYYFLDEKNMAHILDHQVHMAAIAAFRLGRFQDRATYPICLPILSVLVNYGK
jgi:hypothetical protein